MHTSAIVCFALALTAHAVPVLHPKTNATALRRSKDYEVVNVGGDHNPSLTTSVIVETVTAPGLPQQTETVTITIPQTSTSSPTPSTSCSSSSAIPSPTGAAGSPDENPSPRGFHAMDNLARMFGKTIRSRLNVDARRPARDAASASTSSSSHSRLLARGNDTSKLLSRQDETSSPPQLSSRSANVTGPASVYSRVLLNAPQLRSGKLMARGSNGTSVRP